MSYYLRAQYKRISALAVTFMTFSIASVLIGNPKDLIGIKGFGIVALFLSSLTLVLKHELILSSFNDLLFILRKKEYDGGEILDFHGIRSIEIDGDTAFVKTKDGRRVGYAMLRVEPYPFPFQHLEEEKREKYREGWKRVIDGIDFKVFLRISSRKFDIERFREKLEKRKDRGSVNEILDKVEKLAENSEEKRIYITIPSKGSKEEIIRDLETKVNKVVSLFLVNLDLKVKRLSQKELINEIRKHYNPDLKDLDSLANGEREIDVPNSKFFSIDRIRLEGDRLITELKGKELANIFFNVTRYPAELSIEWLPTSLDVIKGRYDIVIELDPKGISETIQRLDSEIKARKIDIIAIEQSGKVPPQSMIEELEERKKLQRSIIEGKEKPISMQIYGRVYSEGDVRRIFESLTSTIDGHGFTTRKASYSSLKEISRKVFVLPYPDGSEGNLFVSSYVSSTFPFGCNTFFSSDTNPDGIYLGRVIPTNAPFFLNPERLPNPHVVILGESGYGKSVCTQAIVTRLFDLGVGSLIIDPQGEYVDYVLSRDGIVLSFGYEEKSKGIHSEINLLDLFGFPLPERIRQVFSLFSGIFSGQDELSFRARSILRESLIEAYSEKGLLIDDPSTWELEPPAISDLVRKLNERKNDADQAEKMMLNALIGRLSEFARGGAYAFFDGRTSFNFEDLGSKLVCINLHPLRSDFAKSLVAYTILQIVLGSFGLSKRFRYLVIDEGWKIVKNSPEEDLLVEIVKTGRKFRCGVIFTSQEIEDIPEKAKTILRNAATKILFKVDEMEVQRVSKDLRLPKILENKLTRLPVGQALVKTVNMPTWVPVMVEMEEVGAKSEVMDQKEVERRKRVPRRIIEIIGKKGMVHYSHLPLTDEEREWIEQDPNIGFVRVDRVEGGKSIYIYDKRLIRNPRHEATVMEVCRFLDDRRIPYETNLTKEPDVVCQIPPLRIAIEVEMGSHSANEIGEKIKRFGPKFDILYILVHSKEKDRYMSRISDFGNSRFVNRRELALEIDKLLEVFG